MRFGEWGTRMRGPWGRGLCRIGRAVGTIVPMLAASGCVLDTERPGLAIDIPEHYRETHGAPNAAVPSLDWWRTFRSPELTSLMEAATTANLDIAVAIAQIQQADAQVRIAGAPLLPTIDYNGTDTANKLSQQTANSANGFGSPYNRLYTTSLSASYIIDFWGKNQAALKAAVETSVASRFNREVVTLTTLASVADTYFTILVTQDRLRIARRNYTDANRILFLIQQQFNVGGIVSDLNVAQQEALVEQVQATIPPLEEILRQSIAALAVLVGKTPESFNTRGKGADSVTIPRVTPGLPSKLLTQRPDLRQAEEQLKSTDFSVESARAAFFPTIELTGQAGFESSALRLLFGPGAWFYSASASLTQPLFDGGLLLGQFELQRGLQQQYLQAYRKAVLSAFSNVEQSLIAVEQTAAAEAIQKKVVASSRRAFTLEEQQLNGGIINLVTLLQIEQTLFQAEDQLAQDRLARLMAVVGLFQALGGGWPPKALPEIPPKQSI
jgi:outer membrane protein, multidrug efflux system